MPADGNFKSVFFGGGGYFLIFFGKFKELVVERHWYRLRKLPRVYGGWTVSDVVSTLLEVNDELHEVNYALVKEIQHSTLPLPVVKWRGQKHHYRLSTTRKEEGCQLRLQS